MDLVELTRATQVAPYTTALEIIFNAIQSKMTPTQLSLEAPCKKWLKDNSFDYDRNQIEGGVGVYA